MSSFTCLNSISIVETLNMYMLYIHTTSTISMLHLSHIFVFTVVIETGFVSCTVVTFCIFFFQTIEIPSMKVTKKVKSIQMFKKPVDSIMQVDCSFHFGNIFYSEIHVQKILHKVLDVNCLCGSQYPNDTIQN